MGGKQPSKAFGAIRHVKGRLIMVLKRLTKPVAALALASPLFLIVLLETHLSRAAIPGAVHWTPGGLSVDASMTILSSGAASKVIDAVQSLTPTPGPIDIISRGGSHISSGSSLYKVTVDGEPVYVHSFDRPDL